MRPEYRKALEGQQSVLLILWIIFVAAVFLYLWIADVFLAGRRLLTDPGAVEIIKVFLWLLAFFDLGTLVWWKRRFLTRAALLGGSRSVRLLQALQGHRSPLEEHAAGVISSYVTSKIVAFVLAEAVAIYGFALAFFGGYFWHQYLLSAASVALLLAEFPSRFFLEELVQASES